MHPCEDLHERRLARAVLADESVDYPRAARSTRPRARGSRRSSSLRLERQHGAAFSWHSRSATSHLRAVRGEPVISLEPFAGLAPRLALRGLVHRLLERGADDLARVLQRAELTERDRLDEQVPDLCRLDGPACTGRPEAYAVHWQSDSLRARRRRCAPSRSATPVASRRRSSVCACFSARLSRTQRTIAPRHPRARGWPVPRAVLPMRRGMSSGAAKQRVVGVDQRAQLRRGLGQGDELLERALEALERPGAAALVQQPQTR